jgi:hypothetical protein
MLYWFAVYTVVSIAVMLPFLALYIVVAASWLGLAGVRLIRTYLTCVGSGFQRFP